MAEIDVEGMREWARRSKTCCGTCGGALSYSCHFDHGTWRCWSCGRKYDGRYEMPPRLLPEQSAALRTRYEDGHHGC